MYLINESKDGFERQGQDARGFIFVAKHCMRFACSSMAITQDGHYNNIRNKGEITVQTVFN
jgi:hypothetical protein